jgi:propanol-preferring alcohol dehydrogenase
MAEYMLVQDADRHLVALPDTLAPELAAPLTDAGLTPFHAVRRSLAKLADPRATALVIGVGGLDIFGVQILDALTSAQVIAVDTRTEALAAAAASGARHTLHPGDNTVSDIRDLTRGRGVDLVLDFVGTAATIALGGRVVRPLGDLTLVGAGGAHARVGFGILPAEVSVQTTFWGTLDELEQVVHLAAQGVLRPRVTHYSLTDALTAYRDLADGKVDGRAVIRP